MKPKSRFIKSVVETARKSDVQLPWERGPRRKETIARRQAAAETRRRVLH